MEKKTIGERKPAILSITRCVSVTFNLALRAIDISMADLPPREMVERGREGGEGRKVSGICVSGSRPAAGGGGTRARNNESRESLPSI